MATYTPVDILEPTLLDNALLGIQTALTSGLDWLDIAFGKCEHLKEIRDKKSVTYPAIYSNKKDYIKLFPDDRLGNFSFFVVNDGDDLSQRGRQFVDIKTEFSLIVWFDFEKVFEDSERRTVEHVKKQVVDVLTGAGIQAAVRLKKAYEKHEQIYRGFTLSEISNQYKMRPYGAFRIDGEIKYNNKDFC